MSNDDRIMNDSTLPLGSAAAARKKKPLARKANIRRGFGLMDWNRLLRSSKDLAQRKGAPLRGITREEVAQHKTEYDGWMILHGKVYNIAPYLQYHPGGVGYLKPLLGKDGTDLFNKYHRWVNIEGLIGPLQIGFLQSAARAPEPSKNYLPSGIQQPSKQQMKDGFAVPAPRPKMLPVPLLSSSIGGGGGGDGRNDESSDEEDLDPIGN